MSLFTDFKQTGTVALQETLSKKNIHQVPRIDKVVVAMWIGSLATRKWLKDFTDLQENLRIITWQQPQMILAKKSVSNFKLREGMPVMLRTTLRWKRAYDLIERLTSYVFPRVRDFDGLSQRKFDGRGNYSFGIKSQSVFPEITPEDVRIPMGIQITIATTADTNEDAKALLQQLWVIFQKK